MANLTTHHVVSTTETWNWRLNFSNQECQLNYNLSNNQIEQQNHQRKDYVTTSVLSSGELSSSSTESQIKKKEMQERRRKRKEKKQIREERRRKKEKRRRKSNTKKHAEDPPSPAYKRVKRANASERFARNVHDDSKFKDIATWVAFKAKRTTLIENAWVANSTLNSQNGEVTGRGSYLYEAISSDEDSLLDFTPNRSEANLTLRSNDQHESELAASVKKLSREELEKVAIRHIAMCEKYKKTELELDMCKGREETFHSMILELNQEVIKLKSMIPPSKTTRSVGVQVQLHSSSGQQNSSSIRYPSLTRIKIEQVEGNSGKESVASNENISNDRYTHLSFFGSKVVHTPASPVSDNHINPVVKQEKS